MYIYRYIDTEDTEYGTSWRSKAEHARAKEAAESLAAEVATRVALRGYYSEPPPPPPAPTTTMLHGWCWLCLSVEG